jgi:hypothetical protein
MVCAIAKRYKEQGTARATAQSINGDQRFGGHGPYRFGDRINDRNDFRFYADNGIPYYRLTELIAPEAISQWYFGPGATVGYSTITGLSTIDHLIREREAEKLDFVVWPHECLAPSGAKHVLAESYPAICPTLGDFGQCRDDHQRDAWRVLQMLVTRRNERRLRDLFQLKERQFGRINCVGFQKQIQFEGFILGIG